MQLFESLVGEERDSGIGDDAQDGGSEASVERLHAFFLGDPHKDVHDVAVPVYWGQETTHNVRSVLNANTKKPFSHRVPGAHISLAVTAILARTMSSG